MKLTQYLYVAAAMSLAHAQTTNLTELLVDTPKCALGCVTTGLTTYNCTLTDLATCLCTSISFQSHLSACVQQSCIFEDQTRAVAVENKLCAWVPNESRSYELKLVVIILSAITFPLVALRCFSRWTITRQIWYDDWAALGAAFFLAALSGIELTSSTLGFGTHYWNVSVANGTILLKLFYASQILYVVVQDLAKISILLLYLRVFPRRWFKIVTKLLMAFIASHGAAYIVVLILQCQPISSIWDRTITGKCVDLTAVGYSGAAFSIFEDVVILVLPISELNTLSFTMKKRISLMLMFSIGSFACVTSMVRLKYLVYFSNSYDSTWDNMDVVIWSAIELYSALICACLPSLRPLLVTYLPSVFKTVAGTSKNNTGGGDSVYRMNHWRPSLGKNGSYSGLGDDSASTTHSRANSTNVKMPEPVVRVVREVDVYAHRDEESMSHHEKREIMMTQIPIHSSSTRIWSPATDSNIPGLAR